MQQVTERLVIKIELLLFFAKILQNHELRQIKKFWTKIRRTKSFVGQNCRNFGLVSKILSDENFCLLKILSDEFFVR